jgi:hypothetical protein
MLSQTSALFLELGSLLWSDTFNILLVVPLQELQWVCRVLPVVLHIVYLEEAVILLVNVSSLDFVAFIQPLVVKG